MLVNLGYHVYILGEYYCLYIIIWECRLECRIAKLCPKIESVQIKNVLMTLKCFDVIMKATIKTPRTV